MPSCTRVGSTHECSYAILPYNAHACSHVQDDPFADFKRVFEKFGESVNFGTIIFLKQVLFWLLSVIERQDGFSWHCA